MDFYEKKRMLQKGLRGLVPFAIAFSAGKDSAFLVREALRTVGRHNFTAVFIDSPLITDFDRLRLDYFQKRFNMTVPLIRANPLAEELIVQNNPDRCYHCKRFLFSALLDWLNDQKASLTLLDGSTASDLVVYRPGARAMAELGIRSPLREAGINSQEIVAELKRWRVPAPFLCSSSCLATRVPYGRPLNVDLLRRIEAMESFWHSLGLIDVRCRAIEDGCRVDVPRHWQNKALKNSAAAVARSREIGFNWIALDLEEVRSGPWDPVK